MIIELWLKCFDNGVNLGLLFCDLIVSWLYICLTHWQLYFSLVGGALHWVTSWCLLMIVVTNVHH